MTRYAIITMATKGKVIQWNSGGVVRVDSIKSYVQKNNPEIFAVTEARKVDNKTAKLEPTGYTVHIEPGENPIYVYISNHVSYFINKVDSKKWKDSRSNIVSITASW